MGGGRLSNLVRGGAVDKPFLASHLQPHEDVFVGIFVHIFGNDLSLKLSILFVPLYDAQYSARNGLANTTNLVDWDWIGAIASPLTPEYLIEGYNITEGLQEQGMRTRGSPFHEFC